MAFENSLLLSFKFCYIQLLELRWYSFKMIREPVCFSSLSFKPANSYIKSYLQAPTIDDLRRLLRRSLEILFTLTECLFIRKYLKYAC